MLTPTTPATAPRCDRRERAPTCNKWLWKQDVPVTDPEVQRTVKLLTDVWNDRATAPGEARRLRPTTTAPNSRTTRAAAWATVLAYMLGDPQFLYE